MVSEKKKKLRIAMLCEDIFLIVLIVAQIILLLTKYYSAATILGFFCSFLAGSLMTISLVNDIFKEGQKQKKIQKTSVILIDKRVEF